MYKAVWMAIIRTAKSVVCQTDYNLTKAIYLYLMLRFRARGRSH
jgi:hypothetical protein